MKFWILVTLNRVTTSCNYMLFFSKLHVIFSPITWNFSNYKKKNTQDRALWDCVIIFPSILSSNFHGFLWIISMVFCCVKTMVVLPLKKHISTSMELLHTFQMSVFLCCHMSRILQILLKHGQTYILWNAKKFKMRDIWQQRNTAIWFLWRTPSIKISMEIHKEISMEIRVPIFCIFRWFGVPMSQTCFYFSYTSFYNEYKTRFSHLICMLFGNS